MKVVAFNGSARKDGNTAILVRRVFSALEKEGIETELVQLAGRPIHGCAACGQCFKNKNQRCAVDDDIVNDCIEKMLAADGIILASPTYFADLTSETKALIDRAGAMHAFDSINHFFLIGQMIIPGSSYWNIGIGRAKGEVEQDEEGLRTMEVLGQNMAWLLKKIKA
jgi:multimeric flavodoxin WrbA